MRTTRPASARSVGSNLLAGILACACLIGGSAIAAPARAQSPQATPTPRFHVQGDHFVLDGKPFQVRSGEMHYARIPRAYWRDRMEMAKAMGLNTIATYVFWNVHEPRPGVYDFSGNYDLKAFLKLAQSEGLYVLLRAGPYSCAEWEYGGFPAWLNTNPANMTALRSNDPAFMVPAARWIKRLAEEVAPLQIDRGGPIIAIQVENEYGNFGSDHKYMEHLRDLFLEDGLTGAMLYTVDSSRAFGKGSLPGVFEGVNFGTGSAERGLTAQAKFRPGQPLFATEYWPGWFDHWGHPHETRSTATQVQDLDYILSHHASVNIYMFHGGTSFGFMAGSSLTGGKFLPDVTSYDYDAPLDEAGHPTAKYFAYRSVFAKYSSTPLPPVPSAPPVIAVRPFPVREQGLVWDYLPAPRSSENPLTMEALGQSYGYVLYRKTLSEAADGPLLMSDVHDYAQVYVNGKLVGTADRRKGENSVELQTPKGARLDILVANDGRINSSRAMLGEVEGITHSISLSGTPLTGWLNYSLPMTDGPGVRRAVATRASAARQGAAGHGRAATMPGPMVGTASVIVKKRGDTFLDVGQLGKGALWLNGHNLGRFWNVGPQLTLFVPGPWLKVGVNHIVFVDLFEEAPGRTLEGRTTPILNAVTPVDAAAPD